MLIPKTRFTLRAFAGWSETSEHEGAKGLPAFLRRRVTTMGRNILTLAEASPAVKNARYVFSSRHGEFTRTLSILDSIAQREEISPADFSLSVHHALISLLSIAHGNDRGHSAVAGGAQGFGLGFIEALACLAEKPEEPVLFLHSDELLPGAYGAFNEPDDEPIAIALLLGGDAGERFSLRVDPLGPNGETSASLAHSFWRFLNGKEDFLSATTQSHVWQWERHGPV